ncbi:hypothetical protein ALC56_15269 [Trachymyrmex septentrionalis]|uniref:Uncharacterized protein n=1 Tax=Trachymyrmex septentrionalis TaxID=34720 RepID=A0A195EQT5_9HYME|nr:hypothetical protein ALC56_15269 [Trachymyrmex septentrionalis]
MLTRLCHHYHPVSHRGATEQNVTIRNRFLVDRGGGEEGGGEENRHLRLSHVRTRKMYDKMSPRGMFARREGKGN